MAAPDFWNDQEKSQETVIELKALKSLLKPLIDIQQQVDDLNAMIEMAVEDEGFAAEVPGQLQRLETMLSELETKALLSGPFDTNSAILSINARDGGTDAHDWAEMLLRMYLNWAQTQGHSIELLDRQDNEEAGINSAAIAVRGPMAYGYLKGESGIHRLIRISPFNAEGKRQTSFAAVDVSPEVSSQVDIEIREEDLEEQAIRASGPGGQHVNKTSSAHPAETHPTGIEVRCQAERSQHKFSHMALPCSVPGSPGWKEKREAEQAAKYTQMPRWASAPRPQLLPAPGTTGQGRTHRLHGREFPRS